MDSPYQKMKSVVPRSTANYFTIFGSSIFFFFCISEKTRKQKVGQQKCIFVGESARKFNWEVRISLSGRRIFENPKKSLEKKIYDTDKQITPTTTKKRFSFFFLLLD
jgi:hypothetical protein